jgi:hypothetical protein
VGYTIPAVSGNLELLNNGFGIQGVGSTQAGGGPMVVDVVYDVSGEVVGITDFLVRQVFVSNAAITSGRGSFVVKAKSDNGVPAAEDYSEVLTVIASANF